MQSVNSTTTDTPHIIECANTTIAIGLLSAIQPNQRHWHQHSQNQQTNLAVCTRKNVLSSSMNPFDEIQSANVCQNTQTTIEFQSQSIIDIVDTQTKLNGTFGLYRAPINGWICSNRQTTQFSILPKKQLISAFMTSVQAHSIECAQLTVANKQLLIIHSNQRHRCQKRQKQLSHETVDIDNSVQTPSLSTFNPNRCSTSHQNPQIKIAHQSHSIHTSLFKPHNRQQQSRRLLKSETLSVHRSAINGWLCSNRQTAQSSNCIRILHYFSLAKIIA